MEGGNVVREYVSARSAKGVAVVVEAHFGAGTDMKTVQQVVVVGLQYDFLMVPK